MKRFLAGLLALVAMTGSASAQIILFDLQGNAGFGLLPGNQNPAVVASATGGEIGAGIFFNTSTNVLTINVGWGVGNGFSNLSGSAVAGHLHGLTASAAPASFSENAGVRYGLDSLPGWNPAASNGGFVGTVNINPADVSALLAGQLYMNVHTATNGGGEIRGNLVAVPEPSSMMLVGCGVLAGAARLRRRFAR
ncbi:MAG: CHRD domain-containing protein [Gemmataceae bacterium]|nr:CHRD domain-containing protein [Gemmataceae bacterium]